MVVLIAKESTELPEIADGATKTASAEQSEALKTYSGKVRCKRQLHRRNSQRTGRKTGNLRIVGQYENYVKQTVFIPTKSAVDEFTGKIQSASNAGDIASCLSAEEKAQSDSSDVPLAQTSNGMNT